MLSGLLGAIFWGLDTVILSIALAPFDLLWFAPVLATALHDLCSAVDLSILMTLKKQWADIRQALTLREGRLVCAAALLGGPVGMCAYVFTVRFLGAPLAAAISSLYPAAGLVISHFVFHTRIRLVQIIGLLLSFGGVCLLSSGSSQIHSLLLGLLAGALCVLGWASEGVLVEHSMQASLDPAAALFLRQSTSSILFALLIVCCPFMWSTLFSMASLCGLSIVLAALCGSASYLFYYRAIEQIGVGRAMPLNASYCVWATVFSSVLADTPVTAFEIICCLMVLYGAFLCARSPVSKTDPD